MSVVEHHSPEIDPSGENAGIQAPERAPLPVYSIVLIVCYSAVFAAQLYAGLEQSVYLAGDDKQAFLAGEYWRMLTGSALHGGLLHYAMNTFALYSFGKIFEIMSARAHLPIVFLLSAIGGAILSLVVNPVGISVGASGGIVGVVGYLVVYSFKRKEFVTAEFRRGLIFNIGFILLYGFVLVGTIDNSAHVGGLLTGAAYALIQVPPDSYSDPRVSSDAVSIAGLVSAGVYAATCVFAVLVIMGVV